VGEPHHRSARYGTRCQGISQFTCTTTRLFANGLNSWPNCLCVPRLSTSEGWKAELAYAPRRWVHSLPRTIEWRISRLSAIQIITHHWASGCSLSSSPTIAAQSATFRRQTCDLLSCEPRGCDAAGTVTNEFVPKSSLTLPRGQEITWDELAGTATRWSQLYSLRLIYRPRNCYFCGLAWLSASWKASVFYSLCMLYYTPRSPNSQSVQSPPKVDQLLTPTFRL